jgi:hypothetical protein
MIFTKNSTARLIFYRCFAPVIFKYVDKVLSVIFLHLYFYIQYISFCRYKNMQSSTGYYTYIHNNLDSSCTSQTMLSWQTLENLQHKLYSSLSVFSKNKRLILFQVSVWR